MVFKNRCVFCFFFFYFTDILLILKPRCLLCFYAHFISDYVLLNSVLDSLPPNPSSAQLSLPFLLPNQKDLCCESDFSDSIILCLRDLNDFLHFSLRMRIVVPTSGLCGLGEMMHVKCLNSVPFIASA